MPKVYQIEYLSYEYSDDKYIIKLFNIAFIYMNLS